MMFHDVIDITLPDGTVVHANVPAYVGNAASVDASEQGAPYGDITTLRALIPPAYSDIRDQFHKVLWRGVSYAIPVPPLPRMKRGRVHHITVPMSLVTGV